jgi:hypothetical protein
MPKPCETDLQAQTHMVGDDQGFGVMGALHQLMLLGRIAAWPIHWTAPAMQLCGCICRGVAALTLPCWDE